MNDFDKTINDAIGQRAQGAPHDRPDFADVLADRQQRMRRRTTLAATGIVAVGITGMVVFAAGGTTERSTSDGPVGSGDLGVPATTFPGTTLPGNGDGLWFCEGAVDVVLPVRATNVPTTTISTPDMLGDAIDGEYDPPVEDSGYFRHCVHIPADDSPADSDVDRLPTTTVIATVDSDADTWTPPLTTTIAPPITGEVPDVPESESQIYIVQSGDYAIKIADLFCVPLEDLLNFNGWVTGSEFPFPGEEISIPPGACAESEEFAVPATTVGERVVQTTTSVL